MKNMKKRLICLALCLVFIASAFLTSCGNKSNKEAIDNITESTSEQARTLTMWLVTEEALDAATASAVNDALNVITQSKFKTKLVVKFYTEAEYKTILDETVRASEDSKNELLLTGTREDVVTDQNGETIPIPEETETNKYGFTVTKYPAVKDNQVDIIYISGYDMYAEYVNNGWLSSLDAELSSSSKKIKEYISTALLNAAKMNNETFAIPNNTIIGEYTYMLLDKELMEECSMDGIYNQGNIDGFFNSYIFHYVETIRKQYGNTYVPIDATYEECLDLLAHYWSINPDTYEAEENVFSFLGYRYTDPATLSKGETVLSFNSLFADDVFCENYVKLGEYRLDGGYFGEAAEGQKAAITFAKGDISAYDTYKEDYYPVIVKYPSINIEDVYSNMFGVCTYTVDLARSMQIVTYLNTNADFRNTLQYGVKDVHYQLIENENGSVTFKRTENNSYKMDIYKTGNTFIAYPDPAKGMDADIWEIGKKQNRQVLIEPLLNFDFAEIVKNSNEDTSSPPKVGPSGYVYSYKSGYAKDLLSQNALLKKWMDNCDATGAGVYVYHTSLIDNQNLSGEIYYYNNSISGAAVQVTDGNGVVNVSYTGTPGNGYDLTVISLYGKKNACKFAWNATVNGAAAATTVKYQNSLIEFDFQNTEKYSVSFVPVLTKGMIYDNAVLWDFVKTKQKDTGADPFVSITNRTFLDENGVEKKVYTYFFFRPTIENPYQATMDVVGNATSVNIHTTYTSDPSITLDKDLEATYAMYVVTVVADADVAVNFSLTLNGNNAPQVRDPLFATDPNFVISGTLDTELVRYFYKFNNDIFAILNGITSLDALKAAVADLNVLLTPQKSHPFTDANVVNQLKSASIKNYVEKEIKAANLDKFAWMLYCATNPNTVTRKEQNADGMYVEVETNTETNEEYVYYNSPYMLYYAWLRDNGYVK